MAGRLRAKGLIKDLRRIEGHPVDIEMREPNQAFLDKMVAGGAKLIEARTFTYRIQAPGVPEDLAAKALQAAQQTGAQIRGFKVAERSLEEAFMDVLEGK